MTTTTPRPRVVLDEGFCTKCGQRVTMPTSRKQCGDSPDCGPFQQENAIPDEVLDHTRRGWWPSST